MLFNFIDSNDVKSDPNLRRILQSLSDQHQSLAYGKMIQEVASMLLDTSVNHTKSCAEGENGKYYNVPFVEGPVSHYQQSIFNARTLSLINRIIRSIYSYKGANLSYTILFCSLATTVGQKNGIACLH